MSPALELLVERRSSFSPETPTSFVTDDTPSSTSKGLPTMLVVGIIVIAFLVVMLIVGVLYHWGKQRRAAKEDDGSADMSQIENGAPRYGFSRANMNSNIILPTPRAPTHPAPPRDYSMQNQRPMTSDEAAIVEHHVVNNELPAAFATFVLSEPDDEPPPQWDSQNQTPEHAGHLNVEGGSKSLSLSLPVRPALGHRTNSSSSSTYTFTVSAGRTFTPAEGSRLSRASFASTVPSPLSGTFNHAQISDNSSSPAPRNNGSNPRLSKFVFPRRDPSGNPIPGEQTGVYETSNGRHAALLSALGSPPSSPTHPSIPDRRHKSSLSSSLKLAASPRFLGLGLSGDRSRRGSMASIASTQSAMVFAKNALSAMRKKALQAFEPLLPDEIPVQVGDTLSLMQQFDDGWCVVAVEAADDHTRPGSAGKGGSATAGEIKMGCVPLWVFERKSKVPGEHMRSMRSTSLAVTVELTASDPAPGPGGRGDGAAPWMREPLYSWSNF